MVLPRVITALVAAPLFLVVLYLGSLPFAVFMFFLVFLALWEFQQMADAGGYATQGMWGAAAGLLCVLSFVFPGARLGGPFQGQAPAFVLMTAILALTARELFRRDKSLSMLRLSTSFLGVFLVAWPLGHMILLRDVRGADSAAGFQLGRNASFFLVGLIWAQDIAAWAVGNVIGRRRLAPAVSPGKSWEGAAGGLLAAVLAAALMREAWMGGTLGRIEALGLAVLLGVLAQVSDLSESLLKRCFGVKDSSQLLPGHGGILDRFDSFIFAAPFLYFYLIISGKAL